MIEIGYREHSMWHRLSQTCKHVTKVSHNEEQKDVCDLQTCADSQMERYNAR